MNQCPKCGKVSGLHSSILPGCMCEWSMQSTQESKGEKTMNYGQQTQTIGGLRYTGENDIRNHIGVEPKRQTQPVMYQIEVMEKNIARLQDVLIQLESRLSPITRPLVGQTSPTPEPEANSPMGQRLYHFNTMLEKAANDIGMLHDSLEV